MYNVSNKCHKYKTSQMKITYKNILSIYAIYIRTFHTIIIRLCL